MRGIFFLLIYCMVCVKRIRAIVGGGRDSRACSREGLEGATAERACGLCVCVCREEEEEHSCKSSLDARSNNIPSSSSSFPSFPHQLQRAMSIPLLLLLLPPLPPPLLLLILLLPPPLLELILQPPPHQNMSTYFIYFFCPLFL